jgi:glycosyltransferase involved in cell wall biosynthesis
MSTPVIFLTSESPYPITRGSKIRDAHLIRLLAETHDVEVLCFPPQGPASAIAPDEKPANVKLSVIEPKGTPFWLELSRKVIDPLRPPIVHGHSPAMDQALRARATPGKLLWVSRLAMAKYLPLARSLGYRVVLDEHHVESNLMLGGAFSQLGGGPLGSLKALPSFFVAAQCSYYEGQFCSQSDAIVATSDIDARRISKLVPGRHVHVIPNSIDCSHYEAIRPNPGTTLFFSGTLSSPENIEGLHWFIDEILPRVKAHMGSAVPRIVVAGASPSEEISKRLQAERIELYPNPPSILPFLAEAAVVFAPLKSGNGTRLKILEAMAAGRAVVSTPKGAEGLVLAPSYDIWIADQPDAFASGIVSLMEQPERRAELGAHAIKTIEERYDWRCARDRMDELLSALGVR